MELEVYEKEIGPKGKAYLVMKAGPTSGLGLAVRAVRERGARRVFLASRTPDVALAEGPLDGLRLTHAHDMVGMARTLDQGRPRPQGRLALEPLTREKKDLFLALYHESFFDVPNSATYDDGDFEQLMGPEYKCGFALLDGRVVGMYELGFKKEVPEIGSIGIWNSQRGKGLGRELLLTVMDCLADLGYAACWLQAATANREAYPLYQAMGFARTEVLGRWYEVEDDHG